MMVSKIWGVLSTPQFAPMVLTVRLLWTSQWTAVSTSYFIYITDVLMFGGIWNIYIINNNIL